MPLPLHEIVLDVVDNEARWLPEPFPSTVRHRHRNDSMVSLLNHGNSVDVQDARCWFGLRPVEHQVGQHSQNANSCALGTHDIWHELRPRQHHEIGQQQQQQQIHGNNYNNKDVISNRPSSPQDTFRNTHDSDPLPTPPSRQTDYIGVESPGSFSAVAPLFVLPNSPPHRSFADLLAKHEYLNALNASNDTYMYTDTHVSTLATLWEDASSTSSKYDSAGSKPQSTCAAL